MSLQDAADTLEAQADGLMPERVKVLAGALALNTLCLRGTPEQDLLDAAAGLEALATGGFALDAAGRKRARHLAAVVRRHASLETP